MARIDLPTLAEHQALSTSVTSIGNRVTALESAPTTQLVGVVQLSSFAGSTYDAKLSTAMTYAQGETRPPYIQFPATTITLNQGARAPFPGMRLVGPNSPGPKIEALNGVSAGSPSISQNGAIGNHLVTLGTGITGAGLPAGSLFHSTNTIYGIYVADLSFRSQSRNAQFWSQTGGSVYAGQFSSLSFYAMRSAFGNSSQKMLNTQCVFDGHWTVTSFTGSDQQFHFGGSDSEFWTSGFCNLEGDAGNGSWEIWFDAQEKSNVGRIYSTNKEGWRGVRVSSNSDGLTFYGTTLEGRNASTPCHGSVIRIEGGHVTLDKPWIAFGMSAPTSFGGGNSGMIHITGGNVKVERPYYERASTVAETVPLIYASGGHVEAKSASPVGSWTGKPRIQITGTATADFDSTFTQI